MEVRIKRNLRFFITAIAVIFIWRGTWGILDKYIIPINSEVAFILLIIVGLIILIIDDFELEELSHKEKGEGE